MQQSEQVGAAQLHGRCGEEDHGFRVVAEVVDTTMSPRIRVPGMMRLINDDQIKSRRRIEVNKASAGPSIRPCAEQRGLI